MAGQPLVPAMVNICPFVKLHCALALQDGVPSAGWDPVGIVKSQTTKKRVLCFPRDL